MSLCIWIPLTLIDRAWNLLDLGHSGEKERLCSLYPANLVLVLAVIRPDQVSKCSQGCLMWCMCQGACRVPLGSRCFFPVCPPLAHLWCWLSSSTVCCVPGGVLDGWLLEARHHSQLFNTYAFIWALSNENFGKEKTNKNSILLFL